MSNPNHIAITNFELTKNGDNSMTLAATGELVAADGTAVDGSPSMLLGFGQAQDIPDVLAQAFTGLTATDRTGELLHIITQTGSGTNAWMVSAGKNRHELLLVLDIPGFNLLNDGMEVSNLVLHAGIVLDSTGRVKKTSLKAKAAIEFKADIGGWEVAGASLQGEVNFKTTDSAEVTNAIADPLAFLDGAFEAIISVNVENNYSAFGGAFELQDAVADFSIDISSESGFNEITIKEIKFSAAAESLVLGPVSFNGLSLQGRIDNTNQKTDITGVGSVIFPTVFDSAFTGINTAGVTGSLHFFSTESATILEMACDGIALKSDFNIFNLSVRELRLRMEHITDWKFAARASFTANASDLKSKLNRLGFEIPGFSPNLQIAALYTIEFDNSSGNGVITAGLSFPAGQNNFADFPFTYSSLELSLSADLTNNSVPAWQLTGSAVFSTSSWLQKILPVRETRVDVGFVKREQDTAPVMMFSIVDGLPALVLPALNNKVNPIPLFQPTRFDLRAGKIFEATGTAVLFPELDIAGIVTSMGVPALEPLLTPLMETVANSVITIDIAATGEAGSESGSVIRVTCTPAHPQVFNLLKMVTALKGAAHLDTDDTKFLEPPENFMQVTPGDLIFEGITGGRDGDRLTISAQRDCVFLGESFSADLTISLTEAGPIVSLVAGSRDPVRISIPNIDIQQLLGNDPNINRMARTYGLNPAAKQAVAAASNNLRSFFESNGREAAFIFDIRDLAIVINPLNENPIGVSGKIELVKFPGELGKLLNGQGISIGLGTSIKSIFIELILPGEPTLFEIPVGEGKKLLFRIGNLRFAYDWKTSAFGFEWASRIDTDPSGASKIGNDFVGIILPGQQSNVSIKAIPTAPAPTPVPEFSFTFLLPDIAAVNTAEDQMGVQAYVGSSSRRFLTLYWKELAFSPTMFMLHPGARFSGGALVGGPMPDLYPIFDSVKDPGGNITRMGLRDILLNPGESERQIFYVFVDINNASLIGINPLIGLYLNPYAFLPPFITMTPPFWLVPPVMMGDLFCDQFSIAVNIPNMAFFSINFQRPLPNLNLAAMVELAALVASGFSKPIPENSALRQVLYVSLSVSLELGIPSAESKLVGPPAFTLEANIADVLNAIVSLTNGVRSALSATEAAIAEGNDIVNQFTKDPAKLVRMIPLEYRKISIGGGDGLTVAGLTINGSASLFLLTPEELEDELIAWHQNKRKRKKGLAALPPAKVKPFVPGDIIEPKPIALNEIFTLQELRLLHPEKSLSADAAITVQSFISRKLQVFDTNFSKLEAIRELQLNGFASLFDLIWEEILARKITTGKERANLYKALKVSNIVENFEIVFVRELNGRKPDKLDADAVAELRENISLALSDDAGAADYGFDETPVEGFIHSLVIIIPSVNNPLPSKAERKVIIENILKTQSKELTAAINELFEQYIKTTNNNKRKTTAAKNVLVDDMASLLLGSIPQEKASWKNLLDKPSRDLAKLSSDAFNALPVNNSTRSVAVNVSVFNGRRLSNAMEANLFVPVDAPEAMVEEVVGFEIRPLKTISDQHSQTFSMVVPSPDTPFIIKMISGIFSVMIKKEDNSYDIHPLPGWFTALATPGLRQAEKLRLMLVIGERRIIRPLSKSEKLAVSDTFVSKKSIYQTSIFNKVEYNLKPTGGRRGPLNVADLLWRSNNTPIVPAGPTLLAGLALSIGSGGRTWFNLKLAGMLAPPSNVLVSGYQKVSLVYGNFSLEMEGEFRLLTGDLWQGISGFEKDVLAFEGKIIFKEGTTSKINARAIGKITNLGDENQRMELNLGVNADCEMSVDFNGQDLAKMIANLTLSIKLIFSSSGFSFTTEGNFGIELWLWKPATTRKQICALVPVPRFGLPPFVLRRRCVTIEEVDLLNWQIEKISDINPDINPDINLGGSLLITATTNLHAPLTSNFIIAVTFNLAGIAGRPPGLNSSHRLEISSLGV